MENLGLQVIYDNDGISASDMEDVRLLVITAIYDDGVYTSTELQHLQDWSTDSSTLKDVFITGRGDFNPINHSAINEVLEVVGSNTRINDDNVYTVSQDPNYYEDWYVYTDNIRMVDNRPLPDNTEILNHFSPSSLYFTDDFDGQILSNGTQYDYQSNENNPAPIFIWDDTDDGVGGEDIPFISYEADEATNTRFTVFGDTSFSDFSFSTSDFHDNLEYMQAYLNSTLGLQNAGNPIGPRVTIEQYDSKTNKLEFTVSKSTEFIELYIDDRFTENITSIPTVSSTFTLDKLSGGLHQIELVAYGNGWTFESSQDIKSGSQSISSFTFLSIIFSFAIVYIAKRKRQV